MAFTLLTKADAGQIALTFERLAFEEIVRDVFADAQILCQTGQSDRAACCLRAGMIRGDRHRLRQLLLNLTDNAVKYNQSGGTIGFCFAPVGSNAELTISNTGAGIAPEVLPRVCERFFVATHRITRRGRLWVGVEHRPLIVTARRFAPD